MTPLVSAALLAAQVAGGWESAPPLPRPVTNNAVAAVEVNGRAAVFSFLGLDAEKTRASEVDWVFRWNVGESAWTELDPVPGPGRLAATAEVVGGRVFLFGGYTVADDGSERSLARVDVLDPATGRWTSGEPIPTPVDDAVSGVWRDSLIYLVSGWHDTGNEHLVQIYDPATDRWSQGTPIPGTPVFGHAGTVVRDAIVYVDGVGVRGADETPVGRTRFHIAPGAWRGDIDPSDPTRIAWTRLSAHPGPPLYRAAAAAVGSRAVFVGGSDTPYNYDGIGYDGTPAEPVRTAFSYDVTSGGWVRLPAPDFQTMDHRSAVRTGGYLVVVGGMEPGRIVTDRVQRISVLRLLSGGG